LSVRFDYALRRRRFATLRGDRGIVDQSRPGLRGSPSQRLMHVVIGAQRAEIVRMRNEGLISAEVMRRVERDSTSKSRG
jgi:hypothetical protein